MKTSILILDKTMAKIVGGGDAPRETAHGLSGQYNSTRPKGHNKT